MSKMIASVDFQIEKSGQTNTTVHGRGGIKTFALPLRQALSKAMEIIEDEFDTFKSNSSCCCTKQEKLTCEPCK